MIAVTVKELVEKYNFQAVSMPQPEKEVVGGYVGDLLSWVMGRAESQNAWITIMTNVNIAAVAQLADISVIIVAEGAKPDEAVIAAADSKGINIVLSEKTAYEIAVDVSADI